jgi:hypothetical protein
MKESRDQGALDAPILSQGTNQARRRSRKRPDPPPPATEGLDHLVGCGDERRRHCEAEHPGGLGVDDQLELCRQHNRQITRLLAFEDASGINAGLTVCIGNAGRVAHQTADLDIIALDVDRGNPMSGRQRGNPFPMGQQERATTDEQRASPTLDERCKGGLDFAAAADVEDFDLLSNNRSRSSDSLCLSGLDGTRPGAAGRRRPPWR